MSNSAKHLLTFILTLTLVNPLCCCDLAKYFADSEADAQIEEVTYTCCGMPIQPSDGEDETPAPDDDKNCGCVSKKKFVEHKFLNSTIDLHQCALLPFFPVEVPQRAVVTKNTLKKVAFNKPPPNRPVRILYSTYLI